MGLHYHNKCKQATHYNVACYYSTAMIMHSLVQFIIVRLLLIFIYAFSLKQLNFYTLSSHCK